MLSQFELHRKKQAEQWNIETELKKRFTKEIESIVDRF